MSSGVGRLATRYLTAAIANGLDTSRRVRFKLAEAGRLDDLIGVIRQDAGPRHAPILAEDGMLYLGYDCFRVPETGLDDQVFRITADLAESVGSEWRSRRPGGGATAPRFDVDDRRCIARST